MSESKLCAQCGGSSPPVLRPEHFQALVDRLIKDLASDAHFVVIAIDHDLELVLIEDKETGKRYSRCGFCLEMNERGY